MLQVRPLRGLSSGQFGAHGVVELEHDADHVYAFMAQVEEQPKWNAGVKLSQIVGKVSQTTTHVKQVVRWSFLALRGDFSLNLRMTEEPRSRTITTEMLQGNMMRRFSSHVGVQRLAPGRCRLEMSLLMQPAIYVPFGVRHMVGGQVRKQLHGVLSNVRDTLEREPPKQQPAALGGLQWPPLFGQPPPLLLTGRDDDCSSSTCSSTSTSSSSSGPSAGQPLSFDSMLKGMLPVRPLADTCVW